ncbi:hemocyte protein-glutamine gamma-glutamyltransferase-like [Maniola hyperantus]|uniref:hemocyte protein-glutamine gamma-glutamyltransferase-like n=1 Tax=Aphantopus hyperantus TaxID=2795564 RepID=UPI001569B039|nr:hemocyte protein-glutamine gamma-glutamyltransferase-like isoform X1 [Maniola hyperantus]XP_034835151.1 hemocyte protein-glutamine gamma-glutamyltransferase-like isoform X1 [Maniola hyperantus]
MEPLVVDIIHFYPVENAQPHNTKKFEAVNIDPPTDVTTTIVRRGQPFNGVVRFNRPYDENMDTVQLVFTLGDKPQIDTQGSMFLKRDAIPDKYSWSAKVVEVGDQDNTISFEISTPVNMPVGSWALRVVTRLKGSPAREVYDFDQDLYILFNPWNPDDQTYMEDNNLLQEYVLNDIGKVWVGPIKTTRGKPWFYGQFDAVVLPAVMFMLDRAEMPFHHRGDPVKVSRVISRIVNSNDDAGVLIGRWDGQYDDGTAPSEWTGSVDILAQYLESQQEVPYGQCWVFAGVVTTVCRALGIPSRVVSNLVSAHDANSSLTVDKYYTETMDELDFDPNNPQGADSIWNYHVWNDVWMARPDLPPGYGGWQAVDATPQETSSGMFQCGPAPLEAIKQGVIGLNYDVEFMLASVNADLMRWRQDPESETGYSMVDTNNYHIGRMILTKKPFVFDPLGDEDRQNILGEYKHSEGSASERMALMNGVRYSERAKRYYSVAATMSNDITFKLREIDTVPIGKDFRVIVDIDNNSEEGRNIKAALTATSVFYNGVRAESVKKIEGKVFVGPSKHEEVSILVKADDYLPKLVEYCNMKISAMAIVDETKQSWADDDDFQVLRPNINIKFNEDLIIGQPTTAVLSFVNPLGRPLTGCEFRLTSSGIAGRTLRLPASDAEPLQLLSVEVPVQPNKIGKINFVATFKSAELKDINGAASVEVFEG